MKTIAVILVSIVLCGCMTPDPKVESTKPWEGHYYSVDEFKGKTSDIELDNNESIWVLSNHTLNRLLKNVGK